MAAWRIFQFRRRLGPDPEESVERDEESRSVRASVTDGLLSATATVDARTEALERYAASLDTAAAELDRQVQLQEMRSLDDLAALDLIAVKRRPGNGRPTHHPAARPPLRSRADQSVRRRPVDPQFFARILRR